MNSVIGPIDLGDWRLMSLLLRAVNEHKDDKKFEVAVGKWKSVYDTTRNQYQWKGCCDVA